MDLLYKVHYALGDYLELALIFVEPYWFEISVFLVFATLLAGFLGPQK